MIKKLKKIISKFIILLKDWRVALYFILILFSGIFLFSKIYTHGVLLVNPSESLKELGITKDTIIYKVDTGLFSCTINEPFNFYSCVNNISNNTPIYLYTSKGTYLINSSLLKNSTVVKYSKIPYGIDIIGGSRIILEPVGKNITYDTIKLAAEVISNRINALGLKEINIKIVKSGKDRYYIIIETPTDYEEILKLIKQQGIFEAKIGNTTVFTGKDIKHIYTQAPYAGIKGCSKTEQGTYICTGYFTIFLSKEAAEKFAEVTKNLSIEFTGTQAYLSKDIVFYLDGVKKSSLKISADLKGKVVQEVQISLSAEGKTEKEAKLNTLKEIKDMQILLSSGALPVKLKVVQINKISPTIGQTILHKIIFVGILAILLMTILVYFIYRSIKATILLIFNILVEILLTLTIGMLLGQTLDIPSLAGLLIAIGTGMDDQLIAIDEILKGKKSLEELSSKIEKIIFIINSSCLTTILAMIPLFFVGLGLLKGFAIMTIIGVLIGAFITRPAFVKLAEYLL